VILRTIRRHPALAIAVAAGLVTFVVVLLRSSRQRDELLRSLLIAWDVTAWAYFLLLGGLMIWADHHRTREISEEKDPGAGTLVSLMAVAAVASLGAVVYELATDKGAADLYLRYSIAGFTLLGSWLMLNTLFAFHYAHLYFRSGETDRPLSFPDSAPVTPDYWDFLYFSFTVAVAAQTSDISVTTSSMRKIVLMHSILVFFFNVAILGATVNVVSGLLKPG
jgi:uncharacterized membrane protein